MWRLILAAFSASDFRLILLAPAFGPCWRNLSPARFGSRGCSWLQTLCPPSDTASHIGWTTTTVRCIVLRGIDNRSRRVVRRVYTICESGYPQGFVGPGLEIPAQPYQSIDVLAALDSTRKLFGCPNTYFPRPLKENPVA